MIREIFQGDIDHKITNPSKTPYRNNLTDEVFIGWSYKGRRQAAFKHTKSRLQEFISKGWLWLDFKQFKNPEIASFVQGNYENF